MPALIIQTAAPLPEGDVRNELLLKLSSGISGTLNKPEEVVMISFVKAETIMFARNAELPAAFCQLHCVGVLSVEANRTIVALVSEALSQTVGIPPNRVFIQFFESKVAQYHNYYYVHGVC